MCCSCILSVLENVEGHKQDYGLHILDPMGKGWRGVSGVYQLTLTQTDCRTWANSEDVRRPQASHLAPDAAEPLSGEPCGCTS